jgi:hypothetical protein
MLSGWIMGGTRFFASASTMASWSGGRHCGHRTVHQGGADARLHEALMTAPATPADFPLMPMTGKHRVSDRNHAEGITRRVTIATIRMMP